MAFKRFSFVFAFCFLANCASEKKEAAPAPDPAPAPAQAPAPVPDPDTADDTRTVDEKLRDLSLETNKEKIRINNEIIAEIDKMDALNRRWLKTESDPEKKKKLQEKIDKNKEKRARAEAKLTELATERIALEAGGSGTP